MKKLLTGAASGLALLAASPMAAFAADSINVKIPDSGIFPNVTIGSVIAAAMGAILVVATILALLYLILGGIQWITSGGDKQGLEGARNKITSAIVGLIIVASTWAIMQLVAQFVGIDIFGDKGIDIPSIKDVQTTN